MIRRSFLREASAVAIALTLLCGWLIAPVAAHNSPNLAHNWSKHYKRMARKIFYTKQQSNLRFVNVGETASDSSLLDGLDSAAFASASHAHSGADITSGTVDESVIDALIARVADVFGIVLAADGSGSTLDADLLDGMSSGAFAMSSHAHSGADITSGTVSEARIDALIARVADVFGIVLAADGSGSTLDADLLDGMSSGAFAPAGQTHAAQWFKDTADSLATSQTSEQVIFTAPENVTITGIFIEPAAALTANDTNYATITVSRRNATGGGQVTVATTTTQATGGTGSWTAFSAVSLGSLSNTSLTAGQKLTIAVSKTVGGVTLPILSVQVEYTMD